MGGSAQYPVFDRVSSAVNSLLVLAGDTLYMEGSRNLFPGGVIDRRLVIIGTGYLLDENPNSSYLRHLRTEVSSFIFFPGSEGSQVIGLFLKADIGLLISTSNITVQRCRIQGRASLENGANNITFRQNYFSLGFLHHPVIAATGNPANIVFNNNILERALDAPEVQFAEVRNNVFNPPAPTGGQLSLRINTASFQNNIIKNPDATISINNGDLSLASYNTAATLAQLGTGNNNIVADMTALFVDPAGTSTDGAYQLKPGSEPGSDGTERGAFGNPDPAARYSLSGLGTIPVIYSVKSPGVANSSTMPVDIKARTIQ